MFVEYKKSRFHKYSRESLPVIKRRCVGIMVEKEAARGNNCKLLYLPDLHIREVWRFKAFTLHVISVTTVFVGFTKSVFLFRSICRLFNRQPNSQTGVEFSIKKKRKK